MSLSTWFRGLFIQQNLYNSSFVIQFSRRCPPKCANHDNIYQLHTGFMKGFWCRPFADWLQRNDMENLFWILKTQSPIPYNVGFNSRFLSTVSETQIHFPPLWKITKMVREYKSIVLIINKSITDQTQLTFYLYAKLQVWQSLTAQGGATKELLLLDIPQGLGGKQRVLKYNIWSLRMINKQLENNSIVL